MKTIWSKDAMPLVPPRFRSVFRYLLPGIDVGVAGFGLWSLLLGSKIVGDFTVPVFLYAWASMILVGAIVAVLSLAAMNDKLELVGRIMVELGLAVYAVLTVAYIFKGNVTSALTLSLVVIRMYASLWRIFDIIGEMVREERLRPPPQRTKGRHA
ncbi:MULTISPECIES: hypothetical protein [unclassified Curtobacterium]|uniref:hypothetical protein n=1 Tax=unclassified Curtobacterium TaxID=257496 RepID=UPI003A7F802B